MQLPSWIGSTMDNIRDTFWMIVAVLVENTYHRNDIEYIDDPYLIDDGLAFDFDPTFDPDDVPYHEHDASDIIDDSVYLADY